MKSYFYSLTKLQKSNFIPRYLGIMPAFTLKTGMGIPEDLLEEFCARHGIPFPKVEFLRLIEEHRDISRRPKK